MTVPVETNRKNLFFGVWPNLFLIPLSRECQRMNFIFFYLDLILKDPNNWTMAFDNKRFFMFCTYPARSIIFKEKLVDTNNALINVVEGIKKSCYN